MGDRISIQFKNGKESSVCFFSHWDGKGLLDEVKKFKDEMLRPASDSQMYPLGRLEPNTVMIAFLQWFLKDKEPINSNYYLGATSKDGDNSDNGHHVINLKNMRKEKKLEKIEDED